MTQLATARPLPAPHMAPPSIDTRFGALSFDPDRVITFRRGLFGFPDRRRFVLAELAEAPFELLQSLDDPELSFLVLPLEPGQGAIAQLDLRSASDAVGFDWAGLAVLVVVTVRSDDRGARFTANLRAPLLIDTDRREGVQYVLGGEHYRVRAPLPVDGVHAG